MSLGYAGRCLVWGAVCLALSGCEALVLDSSVHDLVARRDMEGVAMKLHEDLALVHSRNEMGKTPLHYAVTYGVPEMVVFLLDRGAYASVADHSGMTPLHVASMLNRKEEAGLLIEAGADLEARDVFGDTPFQYAALQGQVGMMELLVEAGVNVMTVNNEGLSPLESARNNRKERAVAFLGALDKIDD